MLKLKKYIGFLLGKLVELKLNDRSFIDKKFIINFIHCDLITIFIVFKE